MVVLDVNVLGGAAKSTLECDPLCRILMQLSHPAIWQPGRGTRISKKASSCRKSLMT
jgi:hypothetical protein